MTGQEIFEAKMRTGIYNDYDGEALELLRQDCERQAAFANTLNGR